MYMILYFFLFYTLINIISYRQIKNIVIPSTLFFLTVHITLIYQSTLILQQEPLHISFTFTIDLLYVFFLLHPFRCHFASQKESLDAFDLLYGILSSLSFNFFMFSFLIASKDYRH